MGKSDIFTKQWLQNKFRFADLFNGILFNGQSIITPEDLQEVNSASCISIKTKSRKYLQRYRDIVMRWHNKIDLALLACENQKKVHYAMPVRNMIYDGLSYTDQMSAIWNSLSKEEKKSLNAEEFFSRFRKEDTLYPVITLVLYYGEREWDGSIDLHEMFGITDETVQQTLARFIPNYKINLIDVKQVTEHTHFQTDLQVMFGMLKYHKDKIELRNYMDKHSDYFSHMDLESWNAASVFLGSEKYIPTFTQEKKEGFNMCKAIRDLIEDGRNEGIVLGRTEGIELGRNEGIEKMITLLRRQNTSTDSIISQIAELYEIPPETVEAILTKVQIH